MSPRSSLTAMLGIPAEREGVLSNEHLTRAIAAKVIHAGSFIVPPDNVQPASLDLRLDETAYRLRCSFLPGPPDRRAEDEGLHHRRARPRTATEPSSRPGGRT